MAKKIEDKLVATLESVSGLKGKTYPIFLPKGVTLPACVYRIDGPREADSLGGWLGNYEADAELAVLCGSYKAVKELAGRTAEKLKGIRYATVEIDEDAPEEYEEEIDAYSKIIKLNMMY